MNRLTVLNVAYPFAPVGPDAVGGAEQVLTQLDLALTRAGHRSLVVAQKGSVTAGTLLSIPAPVGPVTDTARARIHQHTFHAILAAMDRWPVDLVHLHGVDAAAYLPPGDVPALLTLHLPPSFYPAEIFDPPRPCTFIHAVSDSQHRSCPSCPHLLPPIANGVETAFDPPGRGERDDVVALGRICPEKGFHLAIEAAKLADAALQLAGAVFPYPDHERYFTQQITPRLDDRRRFIGPVGVEAKRRFLGGARCLLAPSLVPETSSLVAMEAMACGTPVVAHPAGALAEIVEHGRTGFLVTDVREMAHAIRAAGRLDRDVCRRTAQRRFDVRRTTERYLERYQQLAAGRACDAQPCAEPRA